MDDDDEDMDEGEEASQEETASAASNKKTKGEGEGCPSEVMKERLCNFIEVTNQDKSNVQVCMYWMDDCNKEHIKFME